MYLNLDNGGSAAYSAALGRDFATADGKRVSAINVVTKVDADHATWQVTQLTVDGKLMSDAPALKLKRVKADRR